MARAMAWAVETMKADGLENVRAERGHGAATGCAAPRARRSSIRRGTRSSMLGLGGTVATPPGGLEAEVVPVSSFDDLSAKAAEVKGRIVLFDVAYTTYAETVTYRTGGARAAARVRRRGGAGALGRSDRPAHAAHRQRELRAGPPRHSRAGRRRRRRQPDRPADEGRAARADAAGDERPCRGRRRIGERRGRDSSAASGPTRSCWSAATSTRGTSAPAPPTTGSAASITWEALRLMKQLGLRPRRTVRRRAVDERGARPARRQRLRGALRGQRRPTTSWRSKRTPASSRPRRSASPAACGARLMMRRSARC